jgi:hypothetical protein
MKMSLQDLLEIDHQTLFTKFASVPTHTAYTYACSRLKVLIDKSFICPAPYQGEIAALRLYRHKALKHYQGNLDEFYHMRNSSIREIPPEPQIIDLVNTIA